MFMCHSQLQRNMQSGCGVNAVFLAYQKYKDTCHLVSFVAHVGGLPVPLDLLLGASHSQLTQECTYMVGMLHIPQRSCTMSPRTHKTNKRYAETTWLCKKHHRCVYKHHSNLAHRPISQPSLTQVEIKLSVYTHACVDQH